MHEHADEGGVGATTLELLESVGAPIDAVMDEAAAQHDSSDSEAESDLEAGEIEPELRISTEVGQRGRTRAATNYGSISRGDDGRIRG